MRFSLLVVLLTLLSILSCASEKISHEEWLAQLPQPWTLTEEQMDLELPKFHARFPDFHQRLKHLALWRVGTPYEIFKLGEEIEPDPDPIIRFDVSDCTGHNLTTLAAARSTSFSAAKKEMIDIHYKQQAKDG